MITLYTISLLYVKHVKINIGTANDPSIIIHFFCSRNSNHLHFALCCWQGILNLFCWTNKAMCMKVDTLKKGKPYLVKAKSAR